MLLKVMRIDYWKNNFEELDVEMTRLETTEYANLGAGITTPIQLDPQTNQ